MKSVFLLFRDKKRTLNVYLKKDLNNLQDWFDGGANITTDYWLVQMESNDQQEIQKTFSSYKLHYTTLLFPFHYSGKYRRNYNKNRGSYSLLTAALIHFFT